MGTQNVLNDRIRTLENEVSTLRKRRDQIQKDLSAALEERMNQQRLQFNDQLKRQTKEMEAVYLSKLRQFKERASIETEQECERLRTEINKVSQELESKLNKLTECNNELREQLHQIRINAERTSSIHREVAEKNLRDVVLSRKAVENTPCDFFFAGEYSIINDHVGKIQEEIDKEMYQAAAADAASIALEFDLLEKRVENQLNAWQEAYNEYRNKVFDLKKRIEILENTEIHTSLGDYQLTERELDFWCSGKYLPFKSKVSSAISEIERIQEVGIVSFLKELPSSENKEVFQKCKEADQWKDEMLAITTCIISEKQLSDLRKDIGEELSSQAQEIGYFYSEKGFRPFGKAASETTKYSDSYIDNRLDCYDIKASTQEQDWLKITIYPVREYGVAIRNEIAITYDATTIIEKNFVQNSIDDAYNLVQRVIDNSRNKYHEIKVACFNPLSSHNHMAVLENKLKMMKPDPDAQIKYRERKYST